MKLGAFPFTVDAHLPLLAALFHLAGAIKLGSVPRSPFSVRRPKRDGVFGPSVGGSPY